MTLPEFLSVDEFGHMRCAGHRIGLEDIVYYFHEGYSPEMIAGVFPSLPLSLIYKVIAFYLENRAGVDTYAENDRAQVELHRRLATHGPAWTSCGTDWRKCSRWKPLDAERLGGRLRLQRHISPRSWLGSTDDLSG